ncbi:adenosine receptor A3-like [Saccostrea cucullata]|uniref:adenosine receptor A3-like n=1 Tax=Saccostrea cuccullata TaxID=36930 RepID=UPI002ED6AFFB
MNHFSTLYIIINVICTAIGVSTVFCNTLAAILILKKKRHWDNSLNFILHLCIADNLAGILILWNVIYNMNGHMNFFECLFRSSGISSVIFTSCHVLLGLSLDRYIKIMAPFHAIRLENGKFVKFYLGILWILFFFCLSVPSMTWIHDHIPYNECSFFGVLKKEYLLTLVTFMTFALFCQCLIYGHITFIALSKGNLHLHPQGFTGKATASSNRQILKTTRAVLLVCGLNFITSVPVGIFVFLVSTRNSEEEQDHYKQGEVLMYVATPLYLNSLINPFLYAFKIPDVKRSLSRIFHWSRSRQRVEPKNTTCPTQVQMSVIEIKG